MSGIVFYWDRPLPVYPTERTADVEIQGTNKIYKKYINYVDKRKYGWYLNKRKVLALGSYEC